MGIIAAIVVGLVAGFFVKTWLMALTLPVVYGFGTACHVGWKAARRQVRRTKALEEGNLFDPLHGDPDDQVILETDMQGVRAGVGPVPTWAVFLFEWSISGGLCLITTLVIFSVRKII